MVGLSFSTAARTIVSFLAVPSCLGAQAWLFPKGEGSVTLSYQNIYVHDHVFSVGNAVDIGHVLSNALSLDVDYSVTRRLAVRVALPYVAAKYYGSHPHQLPIDNGSYHPAFQDLSVDLRYNVSTRPVVFTPFFRVVIPSHDYEYFAHSAVGRDLHEYHVGANFGRRLSPALPKAYLQARYSYAFVERILGISPNRSDAEFQFGYFLTRRLSVLGMSQWMHTNRGVDFVYGLYHGGLSDDEYHHHDQIVKTTLLDVGGGAAYAVNRSLEMFLSVGRSVAGRNGHLHAAVITAGSFGGQREKRSNLLGEPVSEPQKAFVCTCPKSR
jgi:hypothetical protein